MSPSDNDDPPPSSPVVKRKPLPRSFAGRTDGDRSRSSALDEDTFPLVPFKSHAAGPPSLDIYDTANRYDGIELQRIRDPALYRPDSNLDPFDPDNVSDVSYRPSGSMLTGNSENDHYLTNKSPAVTYDPLFERSIPNAKHRMWNSRWLEQLSLYCFIILWLSLLAGLLLLWRLAVKQNGISTSITSNHYAWTYGPTAVLVIVGLALKQLDYHCRILAPWHRLQIGPEPARTSLLLDYISPVLPQTLVSASINGDWAVVATGCSILILRIVIVFSTGLLVLTPTVVSRTIDNAIVNSKFVGTNYTTETTVRYVEFARYYGILKYGMSYPYGTTDTIAYDTPDLETIVPNATVTTAVNGFMPYFNCEIVEPRRIQWTWEKDNTYPFVDQLKLNMTLNPTQCPVVLIAFPNICQPTDTECQLGQNIYYSQGWETTVLNFGVLPANANDLDPCSNLYYADITELEYERIQGHPVNTSAAWNVTLTRSIGLVCSVGYTVDSINVTINTLDPSLASNVNASGSLGRVMDVLPGYSHANYTSDFQTQSNAFSHIEPPDGQAFDGIGQLAAYMSGGSAQALLNDPEIYKAAVEKIGKGVGAQLGDHYLRQTDDRKTTATMVFQEQRLILRSVSLWAMFAGFLLLLMLAFAVLLWRPQYVVSKEPDSIAVFGTILAGSRSLQASLQKTGALSDDRLQRHLEGTSAFSCISHSNGESHFSIEVNSNGKHFDPAPASASSDSIKWWRPMSTRLWFMVVVIILSASLIILLEVLQHISDTRNGIVSVSLTSLVEHSLPSILASLVLISTAMMYDAIYFAATTFPPYQALVHGSATAKSSICSGLSENSLFLSKLDVFSSHSTTALLSLVATIIGSTLTIIGSGLYTVENVPVSVDVNVTALDSFVPTFSTSADGGATAVFNLIEHNNASYPALTYDELAFPNIDLANLGTEALQRLQQSETVTFKAKVPATRASLNCTLVPQDAMAGHLYYYKTTTCPNTVLSFNASLPDSCPVFLNAQNQTVDTINLSYAAQFDCSDPSELPAARGAVVYNSDNYLTSEGSYLGATSNPPDCPSLAFMYGYWIVNETSTANVTAMTCIQGIEEVYADTTFEVSGKNVLIRSSPVTDESTSRWLTAFNNTYWFSRGVINFESFNDNGSAPDYFYQAVNYGPGGIPIDELVGPSNADLFISATQHVYRQFMAQLISNTMRQNVSSAALASIPKYPATVTNLPSQRITQNATSKLILQIFLGVMLVCCILIYLLQDMRHVLPHSPWSIAGLMSLLAGAEMVERQIIPPGAEFKSDKEVAKMFDGYVFSLGWWNSNSRTGDMNGYPQIGLQRSMRFGIDIGNADVSSGKRRRGRWWLWR